MRREQRKPRSVRGIGFLGRQKRRCSPMFQGPVTSSRNCCPKACNIFPGCRPSSGWGGRHRQGLHDHGARLYQRSALARPVPKRSCIARGGGTLHDPNLDRGGQGGRPSSAGTRRQAQRRGHPRAHAVRDLKYVAKRATTQEEINGAVTRAPEQQLTGILGSLRDSEGNRLVMRPMGQ